MLDSNNNSNAIKLTNQNGYLSLNFGPYLCGESPEINSQISETEIRNMLISIAPYCDSIRLFTSSGPVAQAYKIAKSLGMRVIGGAWLEKNMSEEQRIAELDALIELVNLGLVDVAAVGNECLYRGDLTPAELADYIQYVKNGIQTPEVLVGTADSAHLVTNQAIIDSSDVILMNQYPFWNGVSIDDAINDVTGAYNAVAAAGGKPVIITESGWPTAGEPEGDAIPNAVNAVTYFNQLYEWSRVNNVEVVLFEAFDESWKAANEGERAAHWGFFTEDLQVKENYESALDSLYVAQDSRISITGVNINTTTPGGEIILSAVFNVNNVALLTEYRIDDGEWLVYNTKTGVTATEDQTVSFRSRDNMGNITLIIREVARMLPSDFTPIVISGTISNELIRGGSQTVCNGGVTTNSIVSSYGQQDIHSNGTASFTTVQAGGQQIIREGGVASNSIVSSNGVMSISSGGTAGNTVISLGGLQDVYSGGRAENTIIRAGGVLNVYDQGVANNASGSGIYQNGDGTIKIYSGGTVNSAHINHSGAMFVFGGTANNTHMNDESPFDVGGLLHISNNGIANDTIIDAGCMTVSSGGTANRTTVNSRSNIIIVSGGRANSVTVSSGGLTVYDGGEVSGTLNVVNGKISTSALVNLTNADDTLNLQGHADLSEATLSVSGGGNVNISGVNNNVNAISVSGGGALSFVLSDSLLDASTAMLSDWSSITADKLRIKVNETQNNGVYYLAGNAAAFDQTISVYTNDIVSGDLSLTNDVEINRTIYALSIVDTSSLVLNVTTVVIPPADPVITLSTSELTNANVVLTIEYAPDAVIREYSFDNSIWYEYIDEIVVEYNRNVYFRSTNADGDSSVSSYEVTNIDKTAPDTPVVEASITDPTEQEILISAVFTQDSIIKEYSFDNETWSEYIDAVPMAANGTIFFRAIDGAGNVSDIVSYVVNNIVPGVLQSSTDGISWNETTGDVGFLAEYSTDDFISSIQCHVSGHSLETLNLPNGTYFFRVKVNLPDTAWSQKEVIDVSGDIPMVAKLVEANENEISDIFFVQAIDVWTGNYFARNVGAVDEWCGTGEIAVINGANRFGDIFSGANDENILYLTDDANGDAIFIDDIYTVLPDTVSEQQSRLANIDEIRAGAGNDIVDMTSQRFEYTGDGMIVRGGAGDDYLWANTGNNYLFGDAGSDCIVGAFNNDYIIGGSGNDSMHGGGGDDIFTFGGSNWGNDVIKQLDGGGIILWFENGIDPVDLTFETIGIDTRITTERGTILIENTGLTVDDCRFGMTGFNGEYNFLFNIGAFSDYSTEKVFETESGNVILASI